MAEEYVPIKRSHGKDIAVLLVALLGLFVGVVILLENRSSFNTQKEDIPVRETIRINNAKPEDLTGKTTTEIVATYGEPAAKNISPDSTREVWVYPLNQKDSTATYLYIEDGVVMMVENNEFTGTFGDDTWLTEGFGIE